MSWLRCPSCGVKRSVEQLALPEGWKNTSCWNCKDPGWIQPYDSDDPLSGRNSRHREVPRPEIFSDDQLKRLNEAWAPFIKGLSEWFKHVGSVMRKWFPAISQVHRAEVKRVHTAYDRKRRARRRRK